MTNKKGNKKSILDQADVIGAGMAMFGKKEGKEALNFGQCCNKVAVKYGLGTTLVTGHREKYWAEAAELYALLKVSETLENVKPIVRELELSKDYIVKLRSQVAEKEKEIEVIKEEKESLHSLLSKRYEEIQKLKNEVAESRKGKIDDEFIDQVLEKHNPREDNNHCYYWHGDVVNAIKEIISGEIVSTEKDTVFTFFKTYRYRYIDWEPGAVSLWYKIDEQKIRELWKDKSLDKIEFGH